MKCEVEFDEDGLVARIARAGRDILRRAGAYVRRVAQRTPATERGPSSSDPDSTSSASPPRPTSSAASTAASGIRSVR